MPPDSDDTVRFKRNHFSTRLPRGCLYCLSHSWLREHAGGRWRVGLTGFATRMLGEIVEFDFEVSAGGKVEVADVIGWIEGFKAVSDVYCAASGVFSEVNPAAVENRAGRWPPWLLFPSLTLSATELSALRIWSARSRSCLRIRKTSGRTT